MKNKLISCAMVMAVLAAPAAAWAQVGGGIKAGANFARVTGADDDDIGDRIGFVAGLFLTTNQGLFAAQPEVVLSMQGSKFSFGTATLDYIQVPILLRIGSSAKNKASIYGLVGPSFGLLVQDDNWDDPIERSDVGLVVGAGVTFSRVLAEVRYTAGLRDFSKGSTAYKNRVFSLMGGFVF
jgi:hypothetical protein